MKKSFLFATIVALAFGAASCSGSAEKATTDVDGLATELQDALNAAGDSAAIIDVINDAKAKIEELEAAGDTAAANAYKWKLKQLFDENKEKFSGYNVTDAASAVSNAGNIGDAIKDAAKADAETAVNDAKDAAKAKIEANEDVQDAKAKVEDAKTKAEEVKQSAEDVKSAAENAKNALKNLKGN